MIFDDLILAFKKNYNPDYAQKMKAYMKDHFSFYGIKAPKRKQLLREWKKENRILFNEVFLSDAFQLFQNYKREATYCAIELLQPLLKKHPNPEYFPYITQLITTHSWWDSVDALASNHLGTLMQQFPELVPKMLHEYNYSNNLWLERSTLIYQLKYKENTNEEILFDQCLLYADSKEFFLQKAIGWALREYAKTAPGAVYDFVDRHYFSPLSIREANKHRKF